MQTSIDFGTDIRKRRRIDQQHSQSSKASGPAVKRQKIDYPKNGERPPAFWDRLSTIPLTKAALKELDRRNAKALHLLSRESSKRRHQPITRATVVKWKSEHRLYKPLSRPSEQEKRFARLGGPDLTDLRGFQAAVTPLYNIMNSSRVSSRSHSRGTKPITNTTKSTGPYDRAFEQHLIDHGVYLEEYEYPDGTTPPPPENLQEINERLGHPRSSLSPSKFSDADFKKFKRENANARKEKQVTTSVIPIIEGRIQDSRCVSGGIPFNNLAHLTDGTLVSGNPDIYYGARPEQLDRQVRDTLNDLAVPSTQHDLPILPNFSLAAKGPDGSLAVAGRQACYDGALGARAIHALQAYAKDGEAYDGNANAITSIYHGGQLKMYTSHPTQPKSPQGRPEYIMTQINTWGMTGNSDTFRQGATAYRNLRDWTKEKRDNAIESANNKVQISVVASSSNISDASLVSSLAAQREETQTTDSQDEELRIFLHEDFNTIDNPETNSSFPPKRSGRPLGRTTSRRKRSKTQGNSASSHSSPSASISRSTAARRPKGKTKNRNER